MGATVLALSFAAPEMVATFEKDRGYPFRIASDEPRAAYRIFGIGRAPWWRIYRPSAIAQHLRLRLQGRTPRGPRQEDLAQLGGDFVIGRDGRAILAHPSVAGDDRVAVVELVAAVRRAAEPPR